MFVMISRKTWQSQNFNLGFWLRVGALESHENLVENERLIKQAVEVSTRMPSVSGSHYRLKMLVTSGSYLVTSGILLVTSGPFPVVTSGSKFWSLPVHFR